MTYLDELKDFIQTLLSSIQDVPKFEQNEDVGENEINLDDECQYSLSLMKMEELDDDYIDTHTTRISNNLQTNTVKKIENMEKIGDPLTMRENMEAVETRNDFDLILKEEMSYQGDVINHK